MTGPAAVAEKHAEILPSSSSPAVLSADAPPRRPRFAFRKRPESYHERFEAHALFYDCFWAEDGERVLLVGPPPVNLDYRRMEFEAGGAELKARFHSSLSVTITELTGVPTQAREVHLRFGGDRFALTIQPNHCATLKGRRLIFTISRDNELSWLREWAHWHAAKHGADAIVLFDNGSTTYSTNELSATLASVPGIAFVAVHAWPHKFGPMDAAVFANHFWSRFLQISSMSVVLRRYGMQAYGLLDSDIDELALTASGVSIFDVARSSPGGLVAFRGSWIEAIAEPGSPPRPPHRFYRRRMSDPKRARWPQRKWALDPTRDWVKPLSVHPYWHWIEGRPRNAKSMPEGISYRHFRGISTDWKAPRTKPREGETMRDIELDRAFEGYEP